MIPVIEKRKELKGPAFWSGGFRPFFLLAGLWAAAAIAIWPPFFSGAIPVPTAFSAVDWHVHEMIYGYGSAVVAGFLLTAIPNWTGRRPVAGWRLAALTGLWFFGRAAVFTSAVIGRLPAAAIDTAFLLVFAAVAGREVIAGQNRRNFKVVLLVLMLAAANAGFHLEAAGTGAAGMATRLGLALLVFLILLIGGRVVPGFTENWLAREKVAERPVPFGRPDAAIMALSAAALALWVVLAEGQAVGAGLLLAGAANLWRLSRWRSWAIRGDALMLVLHMGFFLAALGFLAVGGQILRPDLLPLAAGTHVWAIGAIGTMTLAMMTRATLGHSGRPLKATRGTQAIYLAVLMAMLARIAMSLLPAYAVPLMHLAALIWTLSFAGFVAVYGPMFMHRPGRPG